MLATQIFLYFHPDPWGNDPIWRAQVSDGLKPPTSFLKGKAIKGDFLGVPLLGLKIPRNIHQIHSNPMSCLFLMIFHDRILSMIEILLKVEILQQLLLGSYESRVPGIHSRIYPRQPSITVTTCWTTSKTNLWVIEDCLKGGKCCFGGRVQHFEVLRVFGPKNRPKIHSANKC